MGHGQLANIVLAENRRQFLQVNIGIIQFGASDGNSPAFQEILMEAGVGKRRAVRGD
mgnify:CR=1 FL=1